MITPAHLQLMSRYNRWQNDNIYGAADTLSDAQRRENRGSFFGSVHATLNHILWADSIWMSRLSDWDVPSGDIPDSTSLHAEWTALKKARNAADQRLIAWADGATMVNIDGDMTYANTSGVTKTLNRALCLLQVFNHQTHHRGQVHAMLTAAGARPGDTDIQFLPSSYL